MVAEAERIRDVLIPVYEALGLDWDPATAGSGRRRGSGLAWEDVARRSGPSFPTTRPRTTRIRRTLASAQRLEPEHLG